MPNIDDLKRYAVLDDSGDAATLSLCMEAAIEWYRSAGVPAHAETGAQYDLAVYMLAIHYFDNRGAASADKLEQMPFGVFSLLHQLRLTPEPVSEEATQ